MPTLPPRSQRTFLFAVFIVLCIDRLTKMIALRSLTSGPCMVLPGLSFSLGFNSGISFGLFAGHASWILATIIAFVVAFDHIMEIYCNIISPDWSYGLIIGGAIGNFIDRLWFGGVVDFIDLFYGQWHWPTFNIADSAICIGFILLAWEVWDAETFK